MYFTFATNSETGIFKTALPAGIPTHTKVPLSRKYMMAWLNGVICKSIRYFIKDIRYYATSYISRCDYCSVRSQTIRSILNILDQIFTLLEIDPFFCP